MNVPNDSDDRASRLLQQFLTKLENYAWSNISEKIRSRIDVSQIVNDAAEEWIGVISKKPNTQSQSYSDEQLLSLLMKIVRNRTIDAIRVESAGKRGGQIEFVGYDPILHCFDPKNRDLTSELQVAEIRNLLEQHLDVEQLRVLDLRCSGYSETAIAEQMNITLSEVRRIRKAIVSVAKIVIGLMHDRDWSPQIENGANKPLQIWNFPDASIVIYDWYHV